MTNPLLERSPLFDEALPFDRIGDEHFEPAFDEALARARTALEKLRALREPPTFSNTIAALDHLSPDLERVQEAFSNFLHAHTNPRLQDLAKTVMPKLAAFANDLTLDPAVFARVKAVWDAREGLSLDPESRTLLDRTYRSFAREGALLDEQGKARLRAIDERLAVLSQLLSDRVLAATKAYALFVTDPSDLDGLPPRAVEAAKAEADARGKPGSWAFTLDRPSLSPFLQFSTRRELREKLWRAYGTRACSGEHDARPLVVETVRLRSERAKLLGFETHAHYVLEERMAANPGTARAFLDRLAAVSKPAAERELKELQEYAGAELKPWDVAFWSEKLRKERYDFDEEALRPYFELGAVLEGSFEVARRLYGLTFHERKDLPVYHPDVRVYEVKREEDDAYVGLYYADFFPRDSKSGGAWCTSFRTQRKEGDRDVRPHASIVCNFTKPTEKEPSLLGIEEVRTLFHEFGHALHKLLSRCRYGTLAGANVYWDFVELPSQVMENWTKEEEALRFFARHYKTGERIPAEMIRKFREADRFQAGMASLRQILFASLDFAWHAAELPAGEIDVEAFEKAATKPFALFPPEPGVFNSPAFTHIFAGGYSAGYYSYKWAEVLDADAFELFKEKGVFNREVADRFRTHVLERGGSEHPAELYRRFRGRDADPGALLRRDGLA